MASVFNPLVAAVNIRGQLFGQQVENTHYVLLDVPWDNVGLDFLAENVGLWVENTYRAFISEAVDFTEVVATALVADIAPQGRYVFAATINGQFADANPLPGNVSACISFRTGLAGRSARGRNYVYGVPDTQVSQNNLSETWQDGIITAWQTLRALYLANSFQHVVYSQFTGGNPRPTGLATPVTNYLFVDGVVDSQRRRLTGRGR